MIKRNNKKGFTIVELVIVIAVIAILAGVLIPTFAGVVSKANESKALQEAKNAYTNDLATLDGQVEKYDAATSTTLGEFTTPNADGDYTYTYNTEDGKYACKYSTATGEWTVTG